MREVDIKGLAWISYPKTLFLRVFWPKNSFKTLSKTIRGKAAKIFQFFQKFEISDFLYFYKIRVK